MRKLLLGLATVGVLAVAGVSQAAVGTVELSWDGCTGPVDKSTTTPDFYSIFVTVIGHDQPHRAYDVRVLYGNASQEVPDAWRFDIDGCETSAGITQDVTSKLCPAFDQDPDSAAFTIRYVRFSPVTDAYPTTLMQVLLAHVYPSVTTVDPSTRYFLERIRFDLTYAVAGAGSATTCGGFEQLMYFKLTYATWLDTNGTEIPFNRSNPPPTLTFNGSTPVQPTTWGSIKSQYRN